MLNEYYDAVFRLKNLMIKNNCLGLCGESCINKSCYSECYSLLIFIEEILYTEEQHQFEQLLLSQLKENEKQRLNEIESLRKRKAQELILDGRIQAIKNKRLKVSS